VGRRQGESEGEDEDGEQQGAMDTGHGFSPFRRFFAVCGFHQKPLEKMASNRAIGVRFNMFSPFESLLGGGDLAPPVRPPGSPAMPVKDVREGSRNGQSWL
jgi:hypothetical protein